MNRLHEAVIAAADRTCAPRLLGADLDVSGFDLQQASSTTREACSAACCAHPKCGGAIFQPQSSISWNECTKGTPCCFLKTSVSSTRSKTVPGGSFLLQVVDVLLPAPRHPGLPSVLPASDGKLYNPHGWSASFRGTRESGIEHDEWLMVAALVTPAHRVLELGARYGTTSCAISRAQLNSGRLVAVEPDAGTNGALHAHLSHNRLRHRCNFAIVQGTVGSRAPVRIARPLSYATQTRLARANESAEPNLSIAQLEERIGWRVDTLLLDCEGCIELLLLKQRDSDGAIVLRDEGRRLLASLRLLLLEEDALPSRQYQQWWRVFEGAGLRRVWNAADSFNRSWSSRVFHSAWSRDAPEGLDACRAYKDVTALSDGELRCLPVRDGG